VRLLPLRLGVALRAGSASEDDAATFDRLFKLL